MAYLKRSSRFDLVSAVFLFIGASSLCAQGATLQLKDGRILTGKLGQVAGVAEDPFEPGPSAGEIRTTPLLVIDDGLRRTFIHKSMVREILDEADPPTIRLKVWQDAAERGVSLGTIGAPIRVTPFDQYGRREFQTPGAEGPITVIQGITDVTPIYTRVRGLSVEPRSYVWDMRLATSSIPRDVLSRVLAHATPDNDLDARLQVVRLYLQAERYHDARKELETVQADFEGSTEIVGFDDQIRQLRRLAADRLFEEIELRREAGQYQLVRTLLERFPADGVSGDTLQRVRQFLDEDDSRQFERQRLLEQLATTVEGLSDQAAKKAGQRIITEVTERLTSATDERLTPFRQLAGGTALTPDELAAVAISGWLLGPDKADDNLPVALSLIAVRDQVVKYLREPDAGARQSILLAIRDAQGATVPRVAEILKRIEPPLALPEEPIAPGCYELPTAEGQGRCLVQLPPEYDPLRSYPAIVTLAPIGAPLDAQLNYWAGAPKKGKARMGQAMRRGYVVIAVEWAEKNQLGYAFSPQEHAAVLRAIRQAMRRVSIDSDRIYLTGHGEGADLAWDLALAHPDAWAGVMPFLARAQKYVGWYWQNAEYLPWLHVCSELDSNKLDQNSREFDRVLKPRSDGTVVEYRGRGYDPLSDEIQRAFDWMQRKRRGAPPEEFECVTMRPWDNYFWWVEVKGLPKKSIVAPASWPPKRGVRAASIRGRKYSGNKLGLFARVDQMTVWLSPELVDFEEPIEIEWNGRRITERGELIEPSLSVLLEDARTRGDRRRPYWARVDSP